MLLTVSKNLLKFEEPMRCARSALIFFSLRAKRSINILARIPFSGSCRKQNQVWKLRFRLNRNRKAIWNFWQYKTVPVSKSTFRSYPILHPATQQCKQFNYNKLRSILIQRQVNFHFNLNLGWVGFKNIITSIPPKVLFHDTFKTT